MNYFDVLFGMKLEAKKHPAVIKKRTGNPIELTDAADAPLVKCTTAIQGNQDLHGYDKPWVGGAGKNKLPLLLSKIKTFNTAGTWTGNTYVLNGITYVFQSYDNETITGVNISSNGATGRSVIYYYRDDNAPIVQSQTVTFSGIGGFNRCAYQDSTTWHESTQAYFTATITDGITQIWCELLEGWSGSFTSAPQVEIGSSPTTFAPYSNICPITAYNQSTISVGGKNLFDKNATDKATGYYLNYNTGGVNPSAAWGISGYIKCEPNTTYAISGQVSLAPSNYEVCFYDETKTFISGINQNDVSFTTPNNGDVYYLRFDYKIVDIDEIQLEKGSTATTYEPYTATTHTATFINSIYQGNADFVGGSATAEWGVADLGDLTWSPIGSGGRFYARLSANDNVKPAPSTALKGNFICENYNAGSQSDIADRSIDGTVSLDGNTPPFINILDTSCAGMSGADFKSHVNGVLFAYELATPTTETITPTNLPIKSLFGYNHIESSTGEMEIEYIAENYQEFVDVIEETFGNGTRKGGRKAIDVFRLLDPEREPEPKKEEDPEEPEKEPEKESKK